MNRYSNSILCSFFSSLWDSNQDGCNFIYLKAHCLNHSFLSLYWWKRVQYKRAPFTCSVSRCHCDLRAKYIHTCFIQIDVVWYCFYNFENNATCSIRENRAIRTWKYRQDRSVLHSRRINVKFHVTWEFFTRKNIVVYTYIHRKRCKIFIACVGVDICSWLHKDWCVI